MKIMVVLVALSVQLFLAGSIICPAFADGAPAIVIAPAPVVVQPPPVVVQSQPVVVQPEAVVVQPYPVVEGGVSIQIDPEDYYYADKDVYYHHHYKSDRDEVVKTVPSGHQFLHSKIDLSKVPKKHFRHALREDEKKEKRDK